MRNKINILPVADKAPPDHGLLSRLFHDNELNRGRMSTTQMAALIRSAETGAHAFRVRGDFAIERR